MKNLFTLILFLFFCGSAQAQTGIVRGEVFDDNGLLPGVDISVSEVSTKISTDADGAFAIKLKPGQYDFTFRFPEYKNTEKIVTIEVDEIEDIEVEMTLGASENENKKQLDPTQMQLEEIMTIGQEILFFLQKMVFHLN